MNSTNRTANRLFVLVIGIVLTALGTAAVLLATVPAAGTAWTDSVRRGVRAVRSASDATVIAGTTTNWVGIGVLAVLALLVAVLVVFVARQGRGRTTVALRDRDGEDAVRIDTAVVRDALGEALARRPELVTTSVSSHRVRGTSVLTIAATCRRGVAPTDAVDVIEDALGRLDRLVGTEIPALIALGGGFRARVAARTRLE